MAFHSENQINKLTALLNDRHEELVNIIRGRAIQTDEVLHHNYPETHRFVTSSDIRVAVDDFATILKEIKGTLGKRTRNS